MDNRKFQIGLKKTRKKPSWLCAGRGCPIRTNNRFCETCRDKICNNERKKPMDTRKKKFCCTHCGAKETNFYQYKGDVTNRSFQVRFECGRIVTVLAKNDWKKQETKPCGDS